MLGLIGLQVSHPAAFASGAAHDLMQQLKRTFGRSGIAVGEAKIGIDDADEIEHGKMMPLGDKLRANN